MVGGRWKNIAREWHAVLRETAGKPLQFARQQIASGNQKRSFAADFYAEKGDSLTPRDHEDFKWTAVSGSYCNQKILFSPLLQLSSVFLLTPLTSSRIADVIWWRRGYGMFLTLLVSLCFPSY